MAVNKADTIIELDIKSERFVYVLFSHTAFEKEMFAIEVVDLLKNEKSQILEITSIEKDAKNMYNIIRNNIVHPIHLQDVVCNLVSM